MIVLLRADATADTARDVAERIRALGLDVIVLDEARGRGFEVTGGDPSRVLALEGQPGVREILTRRTPLVGGEPVWPHFAIRVAILTLVLLVALVLLTAFYPPGLGDRATARAPDETPATEWYLRPLAGLLNFFSEGQRWIGGVLVLLFWAFLFAWPFLDRADEATPAGRRVATGVRLLGAALLTVGVLFALGVIS